jgi:transcriptional/translational regulatory protein YebC/TACO1
MVCTVCGYHTRQFSQATPKLSVAFEACIPHIMAGHSKWSNIRRRLQRAGERDTLPEPALGTQPVRYEGYGPGGAAILVDCLTDDRARTAGAVRSVFSRYGGHLGAEGSVSYLFNTVGLMTFPAGTDERRLMQVALEAGAEDVVTNADGSIEVLADPIEFETVRALLIERGFAPASAEVTQRASLSTVLTGTQAEHMIRLLESLESLAEVRHVYSNVEISDEVLARI